MSRIKQTNEDFKTNFWSKVDINLPDECWVWTRGTYTSGYGCVYNSITDKVEGTHRTSYQLSHGDIPKGLVVRHKCDNPACVNPSHLETGTDLDNKRDMVERGRSATGSNHSQAKLTEEQVIDIRRIYNAGGVTQKDLGRRYGLHQTTIRNIVTRSTWRHI